MTRYFAVALIALAAVAATAPAGAAEVNLNFYPIAPRYLDKDFWDPLENQYSFGGTVDFGAASSPLHFAFGLHGSFGEKNLDNPIADRAAAVVNELSFGITKVWTTKGTARPFVSGGVSFVHAYTEVDPPFSDTIDDNDDSIGGWIEGGVYWRLTPHFNFGLFGRTLLGTSITLFGVDGDADYWEYGPMLGWSWPPKK